MKWEQLKDSEGEILGYVSGGYKIVSGEFDDEHYVRWYANIKDDDERLIRGTLNDVKGACEAHARKRDREFREKREEEIKVSYLKPGRILMVDSGEYSDYSVDGLFVVVKPFNMRVIYDKFIGQEGIEDFEIYLLKEGLIDEVDYSVLTTYPKYCFRPGPELE